MNPRRFRWAAVAAPTRTSPSRRVRTAVLTTIGVSLFASVPSALVQPVEASLSGPDLAARVARFDDALDPVNQLSGVLRVSLGDTLLLQEAYGFANAELEVPNTPATRFCIASITKEMTRLIAWQLLVEGKCTLASTLSEYVPDFPRGDEITFEHLLRHRAGIPHRVTTESDTWRPLTAADMTAFAMKCELLVEPGSESIYSSAGYSVLARVIEIIEGKSFANVLRERVFLPAGMLESADVDGRTVLAGRASGTMPGLDERLNAPAQDLSYLVGAGSVFSTVADLERFFRAFRGDTYGENAWASLQSAGTVLWIGATNGFHGFLRYDPDSDVLVIYLGNSFGGGSGQLQDALPALLAGEDVLGRPRPASLVQVEAQTLERYVGSYAYRPGSPIPVGIRDGQLTIADSVAPALSETEFYFQNWSKPLAFSKNDVTGQWQIRSVGSEGEQQIWTRLSD